MTEDRERLARIEQLLENIVSGFKEFKEKGHPDCQLRQLRIDGLTKDVNELGKKVSKSADINIAQTKDLKSLKSLAKFLVKTVTGAVGAIILLIVKVIMDNG